MKADRVTSFLAAFAVFVAASYAVPFAAHEARAGELSVQHAWAPASPGNARNGAVYMTLVNGGAEPDRLVAVASPAARMAGLHRSSMKEGMMRMDPVAAIEMKPGASAALEPGGLHIMLMGLKAPLVAGDRFPLTLTFERAGPVTVEVTVEKRRGRKMKR